MRPGTTDGTATELLSVAGVFVGQRRAPSGGWLILHVVAVGRACAVASSAIGLVGRGASLVEGGQGLCGGGEGPPCVSGGARRCADAQIARRVRGGR